MKYRLTMTVTIEIGGSEPAPGYIADTLRRRLSAGHGGRYVFAGEVVANTIERVLEDEIGDHHTVATVHLGSLETKCEAR